jgi:membrane associated rhomboid family serine protease
MRQPAGIQFQPLPLTPMVKRLLIFTVSVYLVGVVVLQNFFLAPGMLFDWFGFVPGRVITDFWLWQFFTYMFLHSASVFHILFNMLILWMFGSELEMRWGGRFFLLYYLVCGVGAAAIYFAGSFVYFLFASDLQPLMSPVVGASGAVFGLMLAYAIHFGDRVILFMMLFPMKARTMVILLGGVELITLLNSGMGHQVANLAHLGGLVTGFLFLMFWVQVKGLMVRSSTRKRGRSLKLVVDNDRPDDAKSGPRFWN